MKPRRPRKGSLVLVRWDDAYQLDQADHDVQPETCLAETVGWVVSSTRRGILIAAERFAGRRTVEPYRGLTRVPWGMVRAVVVIAAILAGCDGSDTGLPHLCDGRALCRSSEICVELDGAPACLDPEDERLK
ncbi:MAG: hypothetical protein A2Y78_00110 [Acidobacteria bacterium RBG_13_68_16]|nr:MAG: hypothetical protein A2Y78_00110 [Acidobacteria bacterium RBG_13_68_16]